MTIQSRIQAAKGCLIDNRWVQTAESIPVLNPSDGQSFGEIAAGGPEEIAAAVTAATGRGWRRSSAAGS